MKLALLTIYYNSRPELLRLMTSIQPRMIDKWIFIDGIFKYVKEANPNLPSLSDDLSTELIRNSGYNYHVEQMPEATEYEKRNRYLELCQHYNIDYAIIVDTDEYFDYNQDCTCKNRKKEAFDKFKNEFYSKAVKYAGRQNVFNIDMIESGGYVQPRPRCWYNPGQMRYIRNSHYHYANIYTEQAKINYTPSQARTRMYCQTPKTTIPTQLMLVHDPNILTTKQQKLRQQYKAYSHVYEQQILAGKTHKEADLIAKKGNRLNQ